MNIYKIVNMKRNEALAKWLEIKYINWMRDKGEVLSQREFAEFLGLDPMNLSNYLNAKRKMPDDISIKKMADKLGPDIYDVLGLARPDPQLQELTSVWHRLDQEIKDKILELAKNQQGQ